MLNAYRNEAAQFMEAVGEVKGDEKKILRWLTECTAQLPARLQEADPQERGHAIYDAMFLLMELAARFDVNLDEQWDQGRQRKREKYLPGGRAGVTTGRPGSSPAVDVAIVHRAPTPEEDARLRQACGWPVRDLSVYERAAGRALFAVCAVAEDRVVGTGRLTGDGTLWTYVQDMLVLPEYQGRGIGRRIMAELLAFLHRTAPPGSNVALVAAPGMAGFYERFGFRLFPPDRPGMRREV